MLYEFDIQFEFDIDNLDLCYMPILSLDIQMTT